MVGIKTISILGFLLQSAVGRPHHDVEQRDVYPIGTEVNDVQYDRGYYLAWENLQKMLLQEAAQHESLSYGEMSDPPTMH